MASETQSGGTFANDTSVGSQPWSNPGNAAASDDTYANALLFHPSTTYYLKATNYGFGIPTGNMIVGIEVKAERKEGAGVAEDNSIRLYKGGTMQGDDKSTGVDYPTTDGIITYGGPTDLWGLTWMLSDINASDFGVGNSGKTLSGAPSPLIDHIEITVYYSPAIMMGQAIII